VSLGVSEANSLFLMLLLAEGSAPMVSECVWFAAYVVGGLVTGLAGRFVQGSTHCGL